MTKIQQHLWRTCTATILDIDNSFLILGLYSYLWRIRESPPQFRNRIMARVYLRSIIARSTMYQKSSILLAKTGVWKTSYIACGLSSIKINYSEYPKSLISRINEVYVFSIKYRYSDILLKNIIFI